MDQSSLVFFAYSFAFTCILLAIPVIMILWTARVVKRTGKSLFRNMHLIRKSH